MPILSGVPFVSTNLISSIKEGEKYIKEYIFCVKFLTTH